MYILYYCTCTCYMTAHVHTECTCVHDQYYIIIIVTMTVRRIYYKILSIITLAGLLVTVFICVCDCV